MGTYEIRRRARLRQSLSAAPTLSLREQALGNRTALHPPGRFLLDIAAHGPVLVGGPGR